ncbi:MAG: S9 family peptidase, partial [Candidatus Eisenbacteria bacterium]|nr:S9 family peptidase [Candidatus Eisenbacteria bacterium]
MHLLLLVPAILVMGYMQPDSAITAIVDTPLPPWITVSPDSSIWLVRTVLRNPPIAELAMGELRLAGVRFNPRTSASGRTTTFVGLSLMRSPEGTAIPIAGMPDDPRVKSFAWSPDGSLAVFTQETPRGVELWLLSTTDASARRLTGPIISLVAEAYPQWLSSGDGILCTVIPEGRAALPAPDPVPQGPLIQETSGVPSPLRTLQDLLRRPHDEALFEHHLTTEIALVRLDGSLEVVVNRCMVMGFSPSPDGRFVLVTTVERPFPYSVTAERFPGRTRVWDRSGVLAYEVERHGMLDRIPIARGSVQKGRRDVVWREDADATLSWAEALDGGDAGVEAELRDRVYTLAAPFNGEPRMLAELENRFSGVTWSSDTLAWFVG